MRAWTIALCLALAAALAACTKSADTSSSGTATATAAASGAASASSAPAAAATSALSFGGATLDDKTKLPLYPGAKTASSGAAANEAGTVLTTADSFDKVYGWYKSKLPPEAEKAKIDTGGVSSATFETDVTGGKGTVAVTSQGGHTTISLVFTSL